MCDALKNFKLKLEEAVCIVKDYHKPSKQNKQLIHYWKNNVVTLLNPTTLVKTPIVLNKSIDADAESISFAERIFIMGDRSYTRNVYEIGLETKSLISKADMLMGKKSHGLCIARRQIYSIGGSNGNCIGDCEKYSVARDEWSTLPNLQTPRFGNVFSFNDMEVYTIGGFNTTSYFNTIEKLNVIECKKWVYVKTTNAFSPRDALNAVQINAHEVIVFGGIKVKEEYSSFYILKMGDNIEFITPQSKMKKNAIFCYTAAPIFDGENVYGVDHQRNVHVYSVVGSKKWKMIKA